jgi:hypothetical protein
VLFLGFWFTRVFRLFDGYSSLQQYFGGDVGSGFGGGVVVTDLVWFGGGGDESGWVDGLVKLPVCCIPVVVLTQW